MLTVYPSNRLEDLIQLLQAVLSHRQGKTLAADTVLVESKGMQHWIHLQLARMQGISMNLHFQMPSSFIWDLARTLLGAENVPIQSPYSREILTWRIDAQMSQGDFMQSEICAEATRYWAGHTSQPDVLKRFQLAARLADLYEQYLLFRPEWLSQWEEGKTVLADSSAEAWQGWLWRSLVKEQPLHPVILQQQAIQVMAEHADKLPQHVMIFAINTLAPQTLGFFNTLSDYCHIHLFHLNPCVEFWGEIQSDKERARKLRIQQVSAWVNADESDIGHPLLANLGQQGKEFFNILQDSNGYEISAFNHSELTSDKQTDTLLTSIQRDILTLEDARKKDLPAKLDDSLVITSSHSALREIQALHDYLLHQFQANKDLTPRDVLVMCPAIEEYAPYIDAVFRHPWDKTDEEGTPRLPCSIADRTLLDSEPLIGAFAELLQLPDSRFEISKILDFLRLPAIQAKFGFSVTELDTLEWWLKESAVHWGLDAVNKQHILGVECTTSMFTWQWGLERLLLGFAQSDNEMVSQGRLLLPHVEGQQALLLGRLMQLLERLQYHTNELQTLRTPDEWQTYLLSLSEGFFLVQAEEQDACELITQAVNALADYTAQAAYEHKLELSVIRNYLQHRFAQPDSGNHFLTGQITFCSMVPMRSIPFKVIAILGLNDGHFPRQHIPLGFDLLAQHPRRFGDRSRRGDDRYLFLEALISAREKLYLSYQGRDIRKNSQREPSLILKELMNYLEQAYKWKLQGDSKEARADLIQQPLHPFSRDCFAATHPSFDASWLRVTQPVDMRNNLLELPEIELSGEPVALATWVRFFDNPLREFARERLHLFLDVEQQQLEDAEPFTVNTLDEYLIREELCETLLSEKAIESVKLRHQLSGQLPESPITQAYLESWEAEARLLSEAVLEQGQVSQEEVEVIVSDISLSCDLPWLKERESLLVWRPASRKAKDDMRLWLIHLVATLHARTPVETRGLFLSYNKNTKTWQVATTVLSPVSVDESMRHLQHLLQIWQQGLCQPLLVHARLGRELLKNDAEKEITELSIDTEKNKQWQKLIAGSDFSAGLASDAYFHWFFSTIPELTPKRHQTLYDIYQPLYKHLQEA